MAWRQRRERPGGREEPLQEPELPVSAGRGAGRCGGHPEEAAGEAREPGRRADGVGPARRRGTRVRAPHRAPGAAGSSGPACVCVGVTRAGPSWLLLRALVTVAGRGRCLGQAKVTEGSGRPGAHHLFLGRPDDSRRSAPAA